ncbi:MAG: L-rhamnose mutarotase [Bacteroidota bacterium]
MKINSSTPRRYCFACDLKDNPELIKRYKEYHAPCNAWPEITASIKEAGINDMQIYLTGNRMFMIMEVAESFRFARKRAMDKANPKVAEWEQLMSQFQQHLPWAGEDEKWIMLDQIFQLD